MIVIGLTGGIASGKTTAAQHMAELGGNLIDADRVGHRVYEPNSLGFEKIVNEFGHEVVAEDGTIDRQILGGKVFGDADQMRRLTDIAWPEIRRLAKLELEEFKNAGTEVAILEAAVLIEAEWFDLVDEVWVVSVKPDIARERLMVRNGLSEDQAQARLDSQLTNREREEHADIRINNSGDLEKFEKAITRQWKKLQKRVAEPAGSGR